MTLSQIDGPSSAQGPCGYFPGDILALTTPAGPRYIQVTHERAPYPDVIRAIRTDGADANAEIVAKAPTAFVAMVELGGLGGPDSRGGMAGPSGPSGLGGSGSAQLPTVRRVGHATIPASCQRYPTFRMPIRDREGTIVYWWTWDGEGLAVAPEAGDTDLPLREVLSVDRLIRRLQEL